MALLPEQGDTSLSTLNQIDSNECICYIMFTE